MNLIKYYSEQLRSRKRQFKFEACDFMVSFFVYILFYTCLNISMPYITLSDQIKKLHNPQRSDTFVKQLRNAVREGDIDAAETPGPK